MFVFQLLLYQGQWSRFQMHSQLKFQVVSQIKSQPDSQQWLVIFSSLPVVRESSVLGKSTIVAV